MTFSFDDDGLGFMMSTPSQDEGVSWAGGTPSYIFDESNPYYGNPTGFASQEDDYLRNLMDARYLDNDPTQAGVSDDDFLNNYLDIGEQQNWWDTLGNWGGKALGWLGQGNNAKDLFGAGLGALAMYGTQQQNRNAQNMSENELALRRELGLGQLGIADRGMGLQENQFRLDNGIDDMATKALGMQLLVNRGRMSSDQTNPWLNFMFTGREQMFGQDPVIGNAFQTNPFSGAPVGVENRRPSASQFFMPQDESSTLGRILQNVRQEEPSFAEGGPVNLAQRLQQRAQTRLGSSAAPAQSVDQVRQNMRSFYGHVPDAPVQVGVGVTGGLDQLMRSRQPVDVQLRAPQTAVRAPQVQQPVVPQVQQPAWDWRNSPDFQATLQDLSQRTPDSYDWGQSQGFAGGGLAALGYLAGGSTGQADDVNANLSHGEYVFDADVVAALGDGNSEAGARKLDEMRERIRRHKRSAPANKIPPQAKDPMKYLGGK